MSEQKIDQRGPGGRAPLEDTEPGIRVVCGTLTDEETAALLAVLLTRRPSPSVDRDGSTRTLLRGPSVLRETMSCPSLSWQFPSGRGHDFPLPSRPDSIMTPMT